MTEIGFFQIAIYLFAMFIFVKPFGWYMAQVYTGKISQFKNIARFVEQPLYRLCGIQSKQDMNWTQYLIAMLVFNAMGLVIVYLIQRLQFYLPFNPQALTAPSKLLAWNTAVSYVTNTNWQSYSGETTMSYFTQMLGLTTQNFLSAATGLSLLVAFIRGIAQHESESLGNYWVDMTRGVLYILLPLATIVAIVLVSQGVIQNLRPNQTISLIQPMETTSTQIIPMGPVASQIAIKQLGTNGGGFFGANAAHPFENPTPLSNFIEMLAIILLPAAACWMYGEIVQDKRQGWALFSAMIILFIPFLLGTVTVEQKGNPRFSAMGIDPGGNMEGKETRFGIVSSALWTTATTATSNGSVNSSLDSYLPIGGMMPLWMMHLGEVVFGGLGTGLYGMLMFVIITVFVTGLMVGRTPEYLGKKIEPFEMKMASIAVLLMPLIVLLSTAIAVVIPMGVDVITNTGPHGFTEIFYAFTSMANNNGSAFAGLHTNTNFYNLLGGVGMLLGRFWVAIPVLAIAGSMVQKKRVPSGKGTLQTHTPLFVVLLIIITVLLGALSFLPALSLGPIVEQLML